MGTVIYFDDKRNIRGYLYCSIKFLYKKDTQEIDRVVIHSSLELKSSNEDGVEYKLTKEIDCEKFKHYINGINQMAYPIRDFFTKPAMFAAQHIEYLNKILAQ